MASYVSLTGEELLLSVSVKRRTLNMGLSLPTRGIMQRSNWNWRHAVHISRGSVGRMWLSFTVIRSASSDSQVHKTTDGPRRTSHEKEIYKDFSVIGIPGDGRCLFRAIAHGICVRAGKPPPDDLLQKKIADELRAMVADEFVKRREETEWFVEGDFDSYVSHIRKPHSWGGEPELFMVSGILQVPITVYMWDEEAGGLIAIAEYGKEHGEEDPVRVIYHGHGHYDALQIPGRKKKTL